MVEASVCIWVCLHFPAKGAPVRGKRKKPGEGRPCVPTVPPCARGSWEPRFRNREPVAAWPEGPRALASRWCGPARQVLASSSRPAWTTGVILTSFGLSRTHSHSLSLSEDADPAPTRDTAALPSLSLATAHTPDRVPVFQPLYSLPEPSPRSGGRREGERSHRVPKAPLSHWMTSEGLASPLGQNPPSGSSPTCLLEFNMRRPKSAAHKFLKWGWDTFGFSLNSTGRNVAEKGQVC